MSLKFLGYKKFRVGDNGSVWRKRSGIWKKMKLQPSGRTRHLRVQLSRGVCPYVHRLVLESFVGPCPKGMQSRHFPDRDPSNNKLTNLSWSTQSVNQQDRKIHNTVTALRGEENGNAKLTNKEVRDIRRSFRPGIRGELARLGRIYNVTRANIHHIVNNKTHNHDTQT